MGSRRKQKTEKSMIQNLYWKQVFRSPKTKIGLMVVIIFALAAIFAPVLAPHDPLLVDVSIKLKNPSAAYPLGTDQLGRCILSRLLYGAQTTLLNSLVVLAGILLIGIPLGLISGFCGGWIDNLIMRFADIVSTFPSSLLALAVVSVFGAGLQNVMIVLVALWWAPFARILRSQVLKIKEKDFVMAAKASGTSKFKIVINHVLLNSISPIIVYSTLRVAAVIMHIASFSFIGLGTQPPAADWGVMLSDSKQFISTAPLMMIWPGLSIMLVVFSLNMFGEGLNEALMPGGNKKAKQLGDGE